MQSLSSVYLQETITTIGNNAFENCVKLKKILMKEYFGKNVV